MRKPQRHLLRERAGFPGVIGAIDGTYIPIAGPSEFRDSYICRKEFPAFHLQGVCDSTMRFLDVFSAYPGSVHDSRVFKNSPLNAHLQNEPLGSHHLLGDSAYGLRHTCLYHFGIMVTSLVGKRSTTSPKVQQEWTLNDALDF